MSFISGFHPVETFLKVSPKKIKEIFLSRNLNKLKTKFFEELATANNININYCDSDYIKNIVSHEKHQGIAANVILPNTYSYSELVQFLKKNPNKKSILILDSIQDPRNLGACLRNALAFDVDLVIMNKDKSSPINDFVIKSSVGAILKLNIFKVSNLSRTIETLKDFGYWIYGLDMNGKSFIHKEIFSEKIAIVMGSEAQGIRNLVKKKCDTLIKIPMTRDLESLNVSVATGIVLYEIYKNNLIKN